MKEKEMLRGMYMYLYNQWLAGKSLPKVIKEFDPSAIIPIKSKEEVEDEHFQREVDELFKEQKFMARLDGAE